MALLGLGAIAMWWDIAPEHRAEFEDWHTHEHFVERMGIPGFRRGSRWAAADGGEGFFVMYELEAYETLVSPAYLARLNAPSPWSTKMMPHHRHMVRSQCRVLESCGGALSRHALTVRLSPADGDADRLRLHLRGLAELLRSRPGTTAGHLLQHQTPKIEATTEQKIRGGPDPAADWIFIACGYEQAALQALLGAELSDQALVTAGARSGALSGLYALSHSNTSCDVR
ncbi:DUF4286 family protein [Hydrogenophaga sp.]|uniref:DUF4286 family protein n=1 Tax=Hydrogenophaga sp. TaxID=1904254 RepID=UPI00272717E3|nr:DUF4286 family protein [Hydrogenophaga sp.]MDO9438038.1 hypothetical protein [Hydrogenophaga sp.]